MAELARASSVLWTNKVNWRNPRPYGEFLDSLSKVRGFSSLSCLSRKFEHDSFVCYIGRRGCKAVTHGRGHSLEEVSND